MKKHTKSFATFIIAVTLIVAAVNGYAQRDPDEPVGYSNYPMRLIMPSVLTQEPYGVDFIVQVGAFDNYQVSTNAGFAETDICVNPRNPLNFVATDNRITGFSGPRYIYYTLDGGVTWLTNTSVASNQGDPVFAADSLGNFYMAILNSGVYVWKSNNGGATWTGPTLVVTNANADKEWIWTDQTTGPFQNNVYVAYVNFGAGGVVDFWRSTNNGTSWTLTGSNLGGGNANPGPNICTNKQGKVVVAWDNGGGASVRTSSDGGATFTAMVTGSNASEPGTFNSTSGRYVLKDNIRVNAMPRLACDMSNGPFANNLYLIYATNPPGPDKADIYMTRSTDGGATWSFNSPVRVNDDTFGTIQDQWMTDVAVDAQGRVWAYWWDSRNDPTNNILTETWAACSTDGGQTFMPNFMVSNQNFNPNIVHIFQGTQHYYLGDYQGMSGKTFMFPFYCAQNNTLNDYTAYLPDYGLTFDKAVDSLNPNGYNTNVMRLPMMGPYSGTATITQSVVPPPATGTLTFNWSGGNTISLTGTPGAKGVTVIASSTVPVGTYTVNVTVAENGGPRTHTRPFTVLVGNFTGVTHNSNEMPRSYQLFQNYPNPFNPSTVIYYSLPKTSEVNLTVYDVLGKQVQSLVNNEVKPAGEYSVKFDATNLTSGVYYYKIVAGSYSDVRKMIVIK